MSMPSVVLGAKLSTAVQVLFAASAVVAALVTFTNVAALEAFDASWSDPETALEDELQAWFDADDLSVRMGWVFLAVWVSTVILLMVWSNKAHKATTALGPGRRRWTSGWTVGGWFIPVAQFVIPKLVLNEIERIAMAPRMGQQVTTTWRSQKTSAIGWIWWIGLAVAVFLLRGSNADRGADRCRQVSAADGQARSPAYLRPASRPPPQSRPLLPVSFRSLTWRSSAPSRRATGRAERGDACGVRRHSRGLTAASPCHTRG